MSTSKTDKELYLEYGRQWMRFDEQYRKAAARAGLSESAFEILYALCDLGEGCLQRDICQYACASKQTINSSVHKLEKDGILRLEPAESGRGVRVFLTKAGKALVAERVAPFAQADYEAFSSLTKSDRESLARIQQQYLDAVTTAFDAVALPNENQQGRGR